MLTYLRTLLEIPSFFLRWLSARKHARELSHNFFTSCSMSSTFAYTCRCVNSYKQTCMHVCYGPPNLSIYMLYRPCTVFAKTDSLRATRGASCQKPCFVLLPSAQTPDLTSIKYKRRRVERDLLWIVMAERLLHATPVYPNISPNVISLRVSVRVSTCICVCR